MAGLTDSLMEQLGEGRLSKIGQMIGADEKTTGSALGTIGPLLTSALAKNASSPDGAQALQSALAKDHDGSIMDNLGGFFADPDAAKGEGILGHVLGDKTPQVEAALSEGSGLGSNQIGQLLKIAAPLLLGLLGKAQKQQGFDAGALSSFLGKESDAAAQASPQIADVMKGLLEGGGGEGGDGIIGALGKLFGRGQDQSRA